MAYYTQLIEYVAKKGRKITLKHRVCLLKTHKNIGDIKNSLKSCSGRENFTAAQQIFDEIGNEIEGDDRNDIIQTAASVDDNLTTIHLARNDHKSARFCLEHSILLKKAISQGRKSHRLGLTYLTLGYAHYFTCSLTVN
jgi:hypothetical protein